METKTKKDVAANCKETRPRGVSLASANTTAAALPAIKPLPRSHSLTPKAKKIISIASIVAFVLFSVALFWFVGRPLIQFVSQPQQFRNWVQAHGIGGRFAFVGMVVLQVVIAIIPGEPLEIGAGYAYGIWEGTLLCMIGAVIGSAIVFLFVRYFGRKAVEVFFPLEKIQSMRLLQNPKRLNLMVFIAFFIPGTPKDMLSYLVGLTQMRFTTWLAISGIARIPSIITSTIGGDALGMQNYQFAIIVFVCTLVISVAGLVVFNRLYRVKQTAAPKKDDEPPTT